MPTPARTSRRALTAHLVRVVIVTLAGLALVAVQPAHSTPAAPTTPAAADGGFVTKGTAIPIPAGGTRLVSWGGNEMGQRTIPTALADQSVTAVAAGPFHSMVLDAAGRVHIWGGVSPARQPIPELFEVPSALDDQRVVAIASGADHALALTDSGAVVAWGRSPAVQVPARLDDEEVVAITAAGEVSAALTATGELVLWGALDYGIDQIPAAVSGQRVLHMATNGYVMYALTADGVVHGWGWSGFGNIRPLPVPASVAAAEVVAIEANGLHTLALTASGEIIAWGSNFSNQITIPETVANSRTRLLASAEDLSAAVSTTGQLTVWGKESQGLHELPPLTAERPTLAVALGGWHGLAIVPASVATEPSIDGTPVFGERLTAVPGELDVPGSTVTCQWSVAGTPIDGANQCTLLLDDPSWVDQEVTVTTTAPDDADGTISLTSPSVTISAALFTGHEATITGSAWVGGKLTAASSSTPSATRVAYRWLRDTTELARSSTYSPTEDDLGAPLTLEATFSRDGYREVTARQTTAPIADRPASSSPLGAKRLTVRATPRKVASGAKVRFTVTGLAAGEAYRLRIGALRRSGVASPTGTARITQRLVNRGHNRRVVTVTARGARADRTGTTRVVVRPKARAFTARVAYRSVRASDPQTVIVSGLRTGAEVTVRSGNRVLRTAIANRAGRATLTLVAPQNWGVKTLQVRSGSRQVTIRYTVTQRCADGARRCP